MSTPAELRRSRDRLLRTASIYSGQSGIVPRFLVRRIRDISRELRQKDAERRPYRKGKR